MTIPETPVLLLFSGSAVLLLFFTVLIYQMGQKGHKSAPELMGRTKTFWVMLGLFFIAATTHRIVTDSVLALISILATLEYFSFASSDSGMPALDKPLLKYATLALVPLQAILYYQGLLLAALLVAPAYLVLVLPVLLVLENQSSGVLETFGFVSAGALFFIFALGHAIGLVNIGLMPFLMCLLLTELRDLISYWLGKFFSKKTASSKPLVKLFNAKIAERVSPNKTWGVGILSTVLIMSIAVALRGLLKGSGVDPSLAFLMLWGLAIGFFGLMGDLVFSLFKRMFHLKDSGAFLPGNTGIIDRIDGLVLTLPATLYLFWIFNL